MRAFTQTWGAAFVFVSLTLSTSARAATIEVPAGGDLQAALNLAQPGDVIALSPGASYVGNFTLPYKGALSDYITIRSAAPDASLPGANVRITPAYAAQLPKIYSPNSTAALRTATTANHYKLMFLEFQANYKGYGDIIDFGQGDSTQTLLSQVPYALVVDRVYVHGDPIMGQKRGIALHSRDTTIVNSYIADCKAVGQEAQAIGGFNGPGNFDIENNYLEGSTQSFLIGGADPTIPNLVTTGITFRGNYLSKQLAWRTPIIATPANVAATIVASGGSLAAGAYAYKVAARTPAGQTNTANSTATAEVATTIAVGGAAITISWTPVVGASDYVVYGRTAGGENMYWTTTTPYFTDDGTAGKSGTVPSATVWYVKNIFELKNAQDVLVEGNVFENLWMAAQQGYPIVFTPRNQGGTAPWAVVQRVTFQHNLVRHTPGGVNILGVDNINPSQRANHIVVRDNIFDDLTGATWGTGSRPFEIGDGPDSVTIDHNTVISTDYSILWLYGGSSTSPTPITNAVYTNNMSPHNSYGIMGSSYAYGLSSIATYLPGAVVVGNVLAGGSASRYPVGNFFPTVTGWQTNFANYAAGDYHLVATSPYKNAGTDGLDLGANVDVINNFAANALSGNDAIEAGTNAVRITTTAVPDAMFNTPYSQTVGCAGGAAPCAWQIVTSLLPSGLAFDTSTGTIAGTPTAVQTGNLTLTAYDPTWPTNATTATLTVTVDPPPFVLTMPAVPTGQVGMPYQLSPAVSGTLGVAAWSLVSGALPSGVGLDAGTGAIAGTPTQWGTTTGQVQVADSWSPARTASQPVTITVAPTPLVVATASIASGMYQQSYQAQLVSTGGTGATTWSVSGGALPSGVALDPASGFISGSPTSIGTFAFTAQAVDANWPTNVATVSLALVVNAPLFSASLAVAPAGQVGAAYQTAAGAAQGAVGTVTWTGWVPAGLVLNTATGAIAGTPTAVGSWTITLQAHDSYDASRLASATEIIAIAPTPLSITTTSLPPGAVNVAYQATLSTSGGTGQTTWAIVAGALPAGLTLSTSGAISGTSSAAATASFTVQATDAGWTGNFARTTLSVAIAETSVLDDRFDTLDKTKWPSAPYTGSVDTTIPMSASGALQIGPLKANATSIHYNAIASAAYDLSNDGYAQVQLAQAPNTATPAYAMFAVGSDGNDFYRWYESGNSLVVEKKLSGTKTTLLKLPYDAAADQFIRIRTEVNATTGGRDVVFETAPNSAGVAGTFTVRYREAWDARVLVTAIKFEIKAGTSDVIASPGTTWWDNFHAAHR